MKKQHLKTIIILFALGVSINTYFKASSTTSDFLFSNVEALALGENSGDKGYNRVTIIETTYKDPDTGDIIKTTTKSCSGSGNLDC